MTSIRNLAGGALNSGKRILIILTALLLLFVGCSQVEEIPTLVPTADLPTLAPSSTSTMPPTNTAVPTPTPEATLVEPTLAPTNTPTPVVSTLEPTPLPLSGVNITLPDENTEYKLGEEIIVGGRALLNAGEYISVSLFSATGMLLDQGRAEVKELNIWQAALNIPDSVTGLAYLIADVNDQHDLVKRTDQITVVLRLPDEREAGVIELFQPGLGDLTVSGYYMLFDGWVEQPINNLVTVSLWNEECRLRAAVESFRVNGTGVWWGLLFVPTNLNGRVCASASFGTPEEDDWREAQTVIEVLPGGDNGSSGLVIAIPRIDGEIIAGQSTEIEGLAFNPAGGLVTVAVLLDNGRLLTEGVTGVERYGYWDKTLFIPDNAEGSAHILVSSGLPGADDYIEIISPITIIGGS